MSAVEDVSRRYATYVRTEISTTVSPHDDMFVPGVEGNLAHYMSVGRSAIDVIVSALVAANNPKIDTILDLPCGGGRVTRHLRALFRGAAIYAGDLDENKQQFVADQLGATPTEPNPDFLLAPRRTYDLIFVGSLFTHLDERRFRRAMTWFAEATAPNGLLIVTTHGRRFLYKHEHVRAKIEPASLLDVAKADYQTTGFGYANYPNMPSYGLSMCSPTWLTHLVESMPTLRMVSLQEAAWDDHQDALVLQKLDLGSTR